jgi:uncharacterized membrane protein
MRPFPLFSFCIRITALVSCLTLATIAADGQTFTTFDMPSSNYTQPAAINPLGQVTGTYQDIAFVEHGFLRESDGSVISFDAPIPPYLGHPNRTAAVAINASGQITGTLFSSALFVYLAYVRNPDGTIIMFDVPGGEFCFAQATTSSSLLAGSPLAMVQDRGEGVSPTAINDRGQITGVCSAGAGFTSGFLRQPDGTATIFKVPGPDPIVRPRATNPRGQITGYYIDFAATGLTRGFLRAPDGNSISFDVPDDLGALPAVIPTSINPQGQIAGYTEEFSDRGFLRQPDGTIITFTVPNANSTQPASVNSRGDIAGVYFDASNVAHGFLRDQHGTITTFDVPNAINTYPTGINPRGDITGWYSDAGGVHGFVRR